MSQHLFKVVSLEVFLDDCAEVLVRPIPFFAECVLELIG